MKSEQITVFGIFLAYKHKFNFLVVSYFSIAKGPFNPSFRNHCIKIINEHFNEFNDDKYITCFFWIPVSEVWY